MVIPLPVAARKGAEDGVIQGHLKEARPTYTKSHCENVVAQNPGSRARLPCRRQPRATS